MIFDETEFKHSTLSSLAPSHLPDLLSEELDKKVPLTPSCHKNKPKNHPDILARDIVEPCLATLPTPPELNKTAIDVPDEPTSTKFEVEPTPAALTGSVRKLWTYKAANNRPANDISLRINPRKSFRAGDNIIVLILS